MIQVYAKGTTDFSKNGIRLHPKECTVTLQDNGQYTIEAVMPADGYSAFDYGQILRASVPAQYLPAVHLGEVAYYIVSKATGTKMYSKIPGSQNVSYAAWVALRSYSPGDKVTYDKKNWQCVTGHGGLSTPPPNGGLWTQIAGSKPIAGTEVATLAQGDLFVKTGDFSSTYMEAMTLDAKSGYIAIADVMARGDTEERVIPGRWIREQNFTITEIQKEQDEKQIRLTGEHVSYQLGRTVLGDCKVTGVNPATALLMIAGAMKEAYGGNLYTNITETDEIEADWSWKNAQNAIMDPKNGLLNLTGGKLIRDNLDVFLLADEEETAAYTVRYGANMKSVKWKGSTANLITRIYPTAQTEDGSTLLLPEEYIDTVRVIPFIRPEVLKTDLKIGSEVENSDGTKVKLTESEVYTRMRQKANDRFTIDKCDMAEVSLELDWQHMPETEEYAQYRPLMNAAPGDWVAVACGPLGISEKIRMTGYKWDPETGAYKSATFGTQKAAATVASYSLKSNSVTASAIAKGAVTGQNIQAGSITAREIEAYAITADHIASRSIVTNLLAANAITANEINANAITAEKIAANAITARTIAAGAITADKIDAGAITAQKIAAGAITAGAIAAGAVTSDAIMAGAVTADILAAGAVTAQKIAAGAVTADKIDAGAVTADKIDAGAVTADKIAAGAITAGAISATDLDAINAKLGTAAIANAQIAAADIGYLKVKDINSQSAYFGTAVFQDAIGGKLFVPRLMVDYAQMVMATIGDLVIKATNGNYYHLDVGDNGAVTATQVTPTAGEIAQGHTNSGQTIIDTDIVAQNLSTANIYATHALMDEINANIINVDRLFAREATIAKINTLDLSSNTYIRSVVGDWASGSTITQTINSINTRITSLGYGTFYYSQTEPSHSGLVAGDVWIKPLDSNTWDDISQYTWQDMIDQGMSWDDVMGKYEMYCWTGNRWKLLYDSQINADLQTQITQNAYAITLKADQSQVNTLSGQVTQFGAQLEIQSQAISAAVSTVNAKVSNYVQATDPRDDYEIHLGDTWTKAVTDGTWGGLSANTWEDAAEWTWGDLGGARTYVWNGAAWILTSDRALEVSYKTEIELTDKKVALVAEEQAKIGDQVYKNTASITVQAERITQEVARAQNAENGKIDKTTQYQTADSIVSEAVRQAASSASGIYIAKTTQYQSADAIVSEAVRQAASSASGAYIAKTQVYQTADSIVASAVTQAANMAAGAYIAKTQQYQSADQIVSTAQSYTNTQLTSYSTTTQTATQISQYVTNNAYTIKSGIAITADGIAVTGSKYIKLDVDANNYVHINSAGIEMKGSRVSVNGKDMWARDDIIVLKTTDNEQTVINSMSGHHDWVMIKPYYNAKIAYTYGSDYRSTSGTYNTNVVQMAQDASGGAISFGTGASWYNYKLTGSLARSSGEAASSGCLFVCHLSNSRDMSNPISFQTTVDTTGYTANFSFESGHVSGNLCGEGAVIYLRLDTQYAYEHIRNLRLECTCDATTSRVPCTVYYFP